MLNYSKSLEVTYTGKAAHYLWHLIINSVSLMILNTFVGMLGIGMEQEDGSKIPGTPFLAQPLLYSIVWIWCASNPLCEPRCEPQRRTASAPWAARSVRICCACADCGVGSAGRGRTLTRR